jgi:hypothetical protein
LERKAERQVRDGTQTLSARLVSDAREKLTRFCASLWHFLFSRISLRTFYYFFYLFDTYRLPARCSFIQPLQSASGFAGLDQKTAFFISFHLLVPIPPISRIDFASCRTKTHVIAVLVHSLPSSPLADSAAIPSRPTHKSPQVFGHAPPHSMNHLSLTSNRYSFDVVWSHLCCQSAR